MCLWFFCFFFSLADGLLCAVICTIHWMKKKIFWWAQFIFIFLPHKHIWLSISIEIFFFAYYGHNTIKTQVWFLSVSIFVFIIILQESIQILKSFVHPNSVLYETPTVRVVMIFDSILMSETVLELKRKKLSPYFKYTQREDVRK